MLPAEHKSAGKDHLYKNTKKTIHFYLPPPPREACSPRGLRVRHDLAPNPTSAAAGVRGSDQQVAPPLHNDRAVLVDGCLIDSGKIPFCSQR